MEATVVGSYPPPDWLLAYPTQPHLRDAMLVVVRKQELAGIDLVTDGELSRFNADHPETNGMIDYFVSRLDGVRTRLGLDDREEFRRSEALRLLPFMNALEADCLVLELARRGFDELAVLGELEPRIGIGLGVVDIKDNRVESADEIARAIEQAEHALGLERIHCVNPDCGLRTRSPEVAYSMLSLVAVGAEEARRALAIN